MAGDGKDGDTDANVWYGGQDSFGTCAEAILAAVPDVRISIAVLAVSRHNLEVA